MRILVYFFYFSYFSSIYLHIKILTSHSIFSILIAKICHIKLPRCASMDLQVWSCESGKTSGNSTSPRDVNCLVFPHHVITR